MTPKKREVNLELLRIIAMLMVISLHYLGKGNTMSAGAAGVSMTDANFINEVLAWSLEALSYGAVNLYIMISGYFLINSAVRMEKVWKLIVQVLFYSVGIFLIFLVAGKIPGDMQGSFYHYGVMLFPFTSQHYWFASIYLILYLLAPFMAIGLRKTDKKQTFGLVIILLLCFSRLLKFIFPNMVMHDETGYGIIWMTVVFVIAVYIRRFVPVRPRRRWLYFGIYLAGVAMTVFPCVYLQYHGASRKFRKLSLQLQFPHGDCLERRTFLILPDAESFGQRLRQGYSVRGSAYLRHLSFA